MLIQIIQTGLFYIALPLIFITFLAKSRFTGRSHWFLLLLAAVGITAYVFLVANWQMLGYPIRYLLLAYLVYAIYSSAKNLKNERVSRTKMSTVADVTYAFIGLFFSFLAVVCFTGRYPINIHTDDDNFEVQPIDVKFPLTGSTFVVGHGGSIPNVNYHNVNPAQRFALDIGALYGYSFRAKGVLPKELEKYAIYGLPIVAPCTGTVVSVTNELPDLNPPEVASDLIKEKLLNIAGNHVVLDCLNIYIALAHMQKGSVEVKVGDFVNSGDQLGVVGNSGNTSEPHLHIHAVNKDSTLSLEENVMKGEGVALTFEGEFLVRNDIVTN